MPEDDTECESFTVISIDSLLVYDKKYYLEVYLENCADKIVDKQMTDYFHENLKIWWKFWRWNIIDAVLR